MSFFNLYGGSIKNHNIAEINNAKTGANLGDICCVRDHMLRYVRADTAITAGDVVVANTASITVTNITGFSVKPTQTTVGKGYPYVEDSGETWTVGQFSGSYLYVSGNTGVGQLKRIVSNTATRAYYEGLFPEMGEENDFSTDLDITSDVVIISPWRVKPALASGKFQTVMGWAPFAFTDERYGWIVINGMGNPSSGGSGVINTPYIPGDNTAGQGTIAGTSDDVGDCVVAGVSLFAGADDTKWPVLFRGMI